MMYFLCEKRLYLEKNVVLIYPHIAEWILKSLVWFGLRKRVYTSFVKPAPREKHYCLLSIILLYNSLEFYLIVNCSQFNSKNPSFFYSVPKITSVTIRCTWCSGSIRTLKLCFCVISQNTPEDVYTIICLPEALWMTLRNTHKCMNWQSVSRCLWVCGCGQWHCWQAVTVPLSCLCAQV